MRDPERIKRILTLLQQIWEHQPDIRFNQLVSNLQSLYSQDNNSYGRREVFTKNYIDLEKTSYLDFFIWRMTSGRDFYLLICQVLKKK